MRSVQNGGDRKTHRQDSNSQLSASESQNFSSWGCAQDSDVARNLGLGFHICHCGPPDSLQSSGIAAGDQLGCGEVACASLA